MADNLTKEKRSFNMSQIRSSNTKLEQKFFSLLEANNIPHIKHPNIYGKPDCQIGEKILVFVDSDFWHGWRFNQWKDRMPKKYWVEKIERNIKRDKKKFSALRKQGYKVIRIWEHQIKQDPQNCVEKIKTALK